jgi:hypothetical protein
MNLRVPNGARCALLAAIAAVSAARIVTAGEGSVRFLTFDEVREIVSEFASSGAPTGDLPDASSWDRWIGACDGDIRGRVDRGFEDSISNLILYGTAFTALPRVESAEEAVTPEGALTAAARARVSAFATALAREPKSERLRFAASFLARRGIAGAAVQSVLEANLSRFATEQRGYQSTLDAAGKTGDRGQVIFARSTLYHERGLSVDTSLLPNYAIEDTLRAMLRKGALSPGAIRRVAIIGPGLDFADKRGGYDYYPLQTIQPFAVLEAVARLGLGAAGKVELTAFDLNPAVIAHVREAADQARAGRAYTIQLPRDAQGGWNPEAIAYWQHFGDVIGNPVSMIAPPPSLKRNVEARAVAVQPRYVMRLDAVDLDIVAQTLDTQDGKGFDLVVATNILVYYDLFHQALAKAAIARTMNPGGVLVVNHALPSQPASLLEYLGRRSVSYSSTAAYGDDVVVYRRRKT